MTFTAVEKGTQPPAQTLRITNQGKGTLSWSASTTASWLSLSPATGTTTETDLITVTVNTATLTTNLYETPLTTQPREGLQGLYEILLLLAHFSQRLVVLGNQPHSLKGHRYTMSTRTASVVSG